MPGYESSHPFQNGISNSHYSLSQLTPPQSIPKSKKTKDWWKATINSYERIGERQLQYNIRFREYKKMVDGEFTYAATGFGEFQEMPWFDKEIRKLRTDKGIPTHIKHFDFIGIVCNALSGIYNEFEDLFRVDSTDEYSTNEFIRQKTELLQKYAAETYKNEVNRILLSRGVEVNKTDFESQEEADAYNQEIQEQTKALTPEDIEVAMAKNFKVLATEWAQNTLEEDGKEFHLDELDREDFIDYLLSGRYFRHFRVGYDSYSIERWRMEEVFFSQDVDAKYPQDGEFVGRITNLSPSDIINKFGHLLSSKEQESISNYWNQNDDWKMQAGSMSGASNRSTMEKVFPQAVVTPFQDFFEHDLATQYEDVLGQPLGLRTLKDHEGNEHTYEDWLPRLNSQHSSSSNLFSKYLRDDIEVRSDTIQVTEVYWRSFKRVGVLTYINELGTVSQELTTDDLLEDFLADKGIKKIRNKSLEDYQEALRTNNIDDFIDTIVYTYTPEVWKGIKIKGNGSTVKEDLFLDVKPLEYQIKGSRSNIYDVKLPVAGIISVGIAKKLEPYQVLHNICMNQITELLEKELGVFFTFDLMYLPTEYKDGTTEDALYDMRDTIKNLGIFGMDMSKQNTEGNQALTNSFQRQDITYNTQVEYRWRMAMQYKEQALAQIGITPQLLGQPNTYTTSEGVKQGAQASYALITPLFEQMNTAKAKEKEIHIAVAQYCQANNRDRTVISRKGDGAHYFLDIMAEDGELFPLRHLGIGVTTNGKDRKIIETIKQFILNDNTVTRDISDVVNLLTNPTLVEIKHAAQENKKRIQAETQAQRDFDSSQLDKQIEAVKLEKDADRKYLRENLVINNESDERQIYISGLAKAVDSNAQMDELGYYKTEANIALQQQKIDSDNSIKDRKLTLEEQKRVDTNKKTIQDLSLRARELALREKISENSKFESIINKN